MPIVDVEWVVDPGQHRVEGIAQSIADRVGRALGSAPGETWVRIRVLPRNHYAENEVSLDSAHLPVFVTVRRRALPDKAVVATEIAALTEAVAAAVGRNPAAVHIEYAPATAGRMAFGGRLVE